MNEAIKARMGVGVAMRNMPRESLEFATTLGDRMIRWTAKKLNGHLRRKDQRDKDPEGFEADRFVEEATSLLDKCGKRLAKKKVLKPVQIAKLKVLRMILNQIFVEHLGTRWGDAMTIADKIEVMLIDISPRLPFAQEPEMISQNCPRCGAMNSNARHCIYCGSPMELT